MSLTELSILFVAAALFGFLARKVKQPLIIGYLFAGILLGNLHFISQEYILSTLSEVGITLLLFLMGLEININEFATLGRVTIWGGFIQVVTSLILGFLLAIGLGFSLLPSLYIAIALSFSSTILIVKLLSEKRDLFSLYGRITIGMLLLQDFFIILILMFLSGIQKGQVTILDFAFIGLKALILIFLVWKLSKDFFPKLFEKLVAGSHDLLFIMSLAWALGVAVFVSKVMGFSLAIGGFLAGLSLSNLHEHLQVASKTRPLRDFFLTLFFLFLGTNIILNLSMLSILWKALLMCIFVIILQPLIVFIILGLLGYRKRTYFLTGLSMSQISEFSLILVAMGVKLGHINESVSSLITVVGVVTMTTSTYMINNSEKLYKKYNKYLKYFERKKNQESIYISSLKLEDHIVLIGCDRTGRILLSYFERHSLPYVVVDFNPRVFRQLTAKKVPIMFGDITDPEILEGLNLSKSRLVISTISNLTDNMTLLEYVKTLSSRPLSIITTQLKEEAVKLYEAGASYVIVPEVLAGDYIRHILKAYGTKGTKLQVAGRSHFDRLIFK